MLPYILFKTASLSFLFFILTNVSHAADFVPLVPIPGVNYGEPNFDLYIRVVYIIAIVAAALLAVGRLILAGFTYVTSSVVTTKTNARKDIQNAIVGLIIILVAVSVLRAVNPQLTNLATLDAIQVNPYVTRVETYRDDATGQRRFDALNATDAQRRAFMESCTGRYVVVGGEGRCLGEENTEATVNTTARFDELFAASSFDPEEYDMRQSQWNQFVGNLEPSGVAEADLLAQIDGASEIIFAVKEPATITQDLAGYESQQDALCSGLGGESAGYMTVQNPNGGNISVCVR